MFIPNSSILKATVESVGATENNTTIGEGENSIHTVEHFLAVLYGLGINNIFVEIDGPEVGVRETLSEGPRFV